MSANDAQSSGYGPARHLILYDGVCGLCNRLNAFVLPRDRRGLFAFAPLQSATAKTWLRRFGRPPEDLTTFYVVTNFRSDSPALLCKSRAALFVLRTLGGLWRWMAIVGLLPTRLLDVGYDVIARHRYRLFGRFETCVLPRPEYEHRFIDV
ncbi:MAG TPA: DCC1-like thiol-disulfide oxidoreductase family protein [Vicinamibacterales bacterium]|jgi:predicted DCC family thiol-disulfide oxidoreductase YuxK